MATSKFASAAAAAGRTGGGGFRWRSLAASRASLAVATAATDACFDATSWCTRRVTLSTVLKTSSATSEDGIVEQLLGNRNGNTRVRGPEVHDSIQDLGTCSLGRSTGIEKTVFCAFDGGEDVRQRLGADPEDGGCEDVGRCDQGVEAANVECLAVDALNDCLDLFLGGLALQQRGQLAAVDSKRRLVGAAQLVVAGLSPLLGKFERGHIQLGIGVDERLVGDGQRLLDALGKAETDLLVNGAQDEGLVRVQVGQLDVVNPLGPLPGEAKVAQVVGEPVDKPADKLEVHAWAVAVQEADGTAKRGGNGGRRNLAGLGEDGVVVDELVLGLGQLEQLGEDGIDSNVLGLPCRLAGVDIAQTVKGCGALDKRAVGKIAVNVDQELSCRIAVEVEAVDGVHENVAHEAGRDVGQWRDRVRQECGGSRAVVGAVVLVDPGTVDGEVHLGEERAGARDDRRGHRNRRQGLDLVQGQLRDARQAGQRPAVGGLGLQLLLEQRDQALGRRRAVVLACLVLAVLHVFVEVGGVVFVVVVADLAGRSLGGFVVLLELLLVALLQSVQEGIHQALERMRFRRDDLGLLHQVGGLLPPLVEIGRRRGRGHGVGDREEDDLNKLRADDVIGAGGLQVDRAREQSVEQGEDAVAGEACLQARDEAELQLHVAPETGGDSVLRGSGDGLQDFEDDFRLEGVEDEQDGGNKGRLEGLFADELAHEVDKLFAHDAGRPAAGLVVVSVAVVVVVVVVRDVGSRSIGRVAVVVVSDEARDLDDLFVPLAHGGLGERQQTAADLHGRRDFLATALLPVVALIVICAGLH
ncbi:hypothetical protein F503_08801 [Ophiostoma piceae UAMH 11346]|uniref:Uncharacterized protein n=1 Tax=Ophiostoma piceae (strain UAMH 11346) TaxID=1262450 RepID=S3BNW0_OPHP1|nr:hypothetical protein F503_08801 [Ophiostoma piceae UAMH 11346]